MTMLTALIERLEKAEEGSRELSNDIAEAAGWERNDARSFVWKSPEGFAHHVAPDFSRSLDAALMLVPKHSAVELVRCDDGTTGYAEIRGSDTTPPQSDDEPCVDVGPCKTLPLALCIAALTFRAIHKVAA